MDIHMGENYKFCPWLVYFDQLERSFVYGGYFGDPTKACWWREESKFDKYLEKMETWSYCSGAITTRRRNTINKPDYISKTDWTWLGQLIRYKEELSDFHSTVVTQLCNEQIVPQLEKKKRWTSSETSLWEQVLTLYLEGVHSILSGLDKSEEYSGVIEEITEQQRS